MFKESKKIFDVLEFIVEDDILVWKGRVGGRKFKSLFVDCQNIKLRVAEGVTGFQIQQNSIYFSNWDNESFKFDLGSGKLAKVDFEQVSNYKLDGLVFFRKLDNCYIFSNKTIHISRLILGNKNILRDSKIYSTNSSNTQISSYEISSNVRMIWEINLRDWAPYTNHLQESLEVQVSTLLGICQDQLIILLTNSTFIGICTKTGKLLWKKSDVDYNKTNQGINYNFGSPYNPILDESNGNVYILQGETFIEFDLNRLEATYTWHNKMESFENGLFIKQTIKKDSLIFFSAAVFPDLGKDNIVGIFDTLQRKVIWQYKFLFENGGFIPNSEGVIQMNDVNLFVLDNAGVLHIFDRYTS